MLPALVGVNSDDELQSYPHDVFLSTSPVLPALVGVNSVTVTAHVFQFTLVTHPVGERISFQLAAVEYGSALSTYVLDSVVTIARSPCSAAVRLVKSELVDTVKVSVSATHGRVDVASLPLLSSTGTFQLLVPVFFVAAVPRLAQ